MEQSKKSIKSLSRNVFIVGSGRSGTTLLRNLLDLHPKVGVTPEIHLFDRLLNRRVKFRDIDREIEGEDIQYWIGKLKKFKDRSRDPGDWCKRDICDIEKNLLQCRRCRDVINTALIEFSSKQECDVIVEKTPINIFFLDQILEVFDDCLVINMVRDGREVCASAMKRDWSDDVEHLMALWLEATREGIVREKQIGRRIISVRYEDLVGEPLITLQHVFDSIGLGELEHEFVDQVLRVSRRSAFGGGQRGLIASTNFSKYFSEREQENVGNVLNRRLRILGYDVTSARRNVLSIGALRTSLKRIKIRMHIWLLKRGIHMS